MTATAVAQSGSPRTSDRTRTARSTRPRNTSSKISLRRMLVVLPTGTGKTVVFAALVRQQRIGKWLDTYAVRHRKMLVIAHREELLDQAARRSTMRIQICSSKSSRAIGTPRRSPTSSSRACRRWSHRSAGAYVSSIPKTSASSCATKRTTRQPRATSAIYQHFGLLPPEEFNWNRRSDRDRSRPTTCSRGSARASTQWDKTYSPIASCSA
jgi:hypothetical protein